MDNERSMIDEVRQKAMQELAERYGDDSRETIKSVTRYKSLPITAAQNQSEVPLTLEDVVLIVKQKVLRNGESIPIYEVFGENGTKVLETQDDGRMKLDKEIFDELLKDKIKMIEEAGYEVASMSSMDEQGKIESFFELINGKITAINKNQRDRIERATDRDAVMEDIYNESMDSEELSQETQDIQDIETSQTTEVQNENETEVTEQLQAQGIDAVAVTKEIDDSVFESNTNTKGARAALTRDGHIEIVHEVDGKLEKVEGFGDSTNRTGETFVAWNDDEQIGDQVHTYGEVKKGDMTYSITKDGYGDIELVEKRENRGGHGAQNEQYIARGVQNKGTAHYKGDREGTDTSITRRTFDSKGQSKDYAYTGKGGAGEVANSNKKHTGSKDYTMEGFSAHDNLKIQEAMRLVDEALKKNAISLDPDTEANLEKRVAAYVTSTEHVFCEDDAQAYAMEAQIDMKNQAQLKKEQEQATESQEQEQESSNDRDRLSEEEARRMAKR